MASGLAARALVNSAEKSSWPGQAVYSSPTTCPLKFALTPAATSLPAACLGSSRNSVLTPFLLRYSPVACAAWSPCQETEKKYGEHCSPAICEGPALA